MPATPTVRMILLVDLFLDTFILPFLHLPTAVPLPRPSHVPFGSYRYYTYVGCIPWFYALFVPIAVLFFCYLPCMGL